MTVMEGIFDSLGNKSLRQLFRFVRFIFYFVARVNHNNTNISFLDYQLISKCKQTNCPKELKIFFFAFCHSSIVKTPDTVKANGATGEMTDVDGIANVDEATCRVYLSADRNLIQFMKLVM